MSGRFRTVVVFLSSWAMVGVLAAVAPVGASAAVTDPGGYTSLAPARLLDTRSAVGVTTTTPVAAGGTVALQVLGRGGVPASGVSAVVLNVTVAAPTASGYVTVYGDGTTRPTASNLNYVRGQVVPNLVIAPVGAGGKVALYNGSAGTTHLVADVAGYFLAGTPAASGTFASLAPSRLLDTRSGLGAPAGAVAPGGTVHLQVTGSGGVPSTGDVPSAVVLNVTVAAPTASGFVTVYGDGTTRPTASNLNYVRGQVVPNLVVAPVGANGKVALFNGSTGTVQLIADVAGYFLPGTPTAAGALRALAPTRLLDTRSGVGTPTGAVTPGGTLSLQVAGRGGVPASGASAVVLNVTVAAPTDSGYVTVYGDGTTRPTASNLNYVRGQVVPNLVIAPVGANGKVALFNGSGGTVQLIADVAGYYRSTTVSNDKSASAWGLNLHGQLGDGTTTDRRSPVWVGTDTGWAAVAAGRYHTVAVKTDGTLWAWGQNNNGQLGDGTTTNRSTPAQVGTDTGWATVAAGGEHTVAVKTDGTLWAWGNNVYGQLGDGTTTNRSTPVQVGTGTGWATVAAGALYTVAVKTDGTLWAWGYNFYGQLGDGTTTNRSTPVQVGTDTGWATVSAGAQHTVAVKTDDTLWAWGLNVYGQLGDGTTTNRSTPAQVGTDDHWATVAAGGYHTVAVKTDGALWAWGQNNNGQLGDGTTTNRSTPAQVGTDTGWAAVAAGVYHTVAVKTDGTLWTWGYNSYGQLGYPTILDPDTLRMRDQPTPQQVGGDTSWAPVTAGGYHTVALFDGERSW